MAFRADIDDDHVLDFQRWHNCEHVPERVSIPGFLAGRRYRVMDNRPRFLMFYEATGPDVFTSPPYVAALNAPTPWTRQALTWFRNPLRTVYGLAAGAGGPGRFVAPYLRTLRFDLADADATAVFADWVAAAAAQDGVQRARMWQIDSAGSEVETSERAIYGGGPGRQAFLALIEFDMPPDEAALPEAAADRAAPGLADARLHPVTETFWLEIAHDKAMAGTEATT